MSTMEVVESQESLNSEVEELRSALTTVTEALILFQEFIEGEIGEMSYFRDSGSYYKLVEILNKMRVRALKVASPAMKQSSMMQNQYQQSMGISSNVDAEDDEEVEVDVDYSDDDPVDEITISQVFSVPSPEKGPAEALLKINNSAITITPVFPDEKKKEQPQVMHPQSAVIIPLDKNQNPASTFESMDVAGTQLSVVDHQRLISSASKQETKDIVQATVNEVGVSMSGSQVRPVIVGTTVKKPKKGSSTKKSLLKISSTPLKKILGRPKGSTKGAGLMAKSKSPAKSKSIPVNNGIDAPLDLQKKSRRPSERPVKCSFCGKCYSSKGVMSRHIKEAHQAEPQFPCFYCPLKFRNGPGRLEHMNSCHPEDMNSITCPYCNRRSTSVAGKRNHMMLCARKHYGALNLTHTPKSSTKEGLSTSPSDSGVELEASFSG